MFLLQWRAPQFYRDDDPQQGYTFLIGIGVFVLVMIIIFFIQGRFSRSASSQARARTGSRRFSPSSIRRIASEYSLKRDQRKLLTYVFRVNNANDPERVINDPAALDRHFKRAFRDIQVTSNTPEELQQRLVNFFALRNTLEAYSGMGDATPTRLIENTPAVLMADRSNYIVRVISSLGNTVVTEFPRSVLGTSIRFTKGARVSLSFYTKSSKGFSFQGNILGPVSTSRGLGLQIALTGKPIPLTKRMSRRRNCMARCDFSQVTISSGGRRKSSKMTVEKVKNVGTIQDISIGGCLIRTRSPILSGTRLRINIQELDENPQISVLGQVLRTNRSGYLDNLLHIKFIQVPRKAYNAINTKVYGYDEV
ncbi:MAG: PilZ domain-containing protein [Treponema sp.]|nr:PilZ domain-containing protein [Treponema sp.]